MNAKGISRSENMRRIRGKNTGPELAVRGLRDLPALSARLAAFMEG